MKALCFPLNFLVIAIFCVASSLQAGVAVNDCVMSGNFDEGSHLRQWPEEVKYSAPIYGIPQSAGTTFRSLFLPDEEGNPKFSRVVGQAFDIPSGDGDQILEKIFMPARVALPGNIPIRFKVRLVDLGSSPDLEEYEEGSNLFRSNPEVEIATPSADKGSGQIVSFTFTGDDRIRLKAGNSYAFELVADPKNAPNAHFFWLRGVGKPSQLGKAPAFRVPFTDEANASDLRTAIKGRQAFIGIKTSSAQ